MLEQNPSVKSIKPAQTRERALTEPSVKTCLRCIYDENTPALEFDSEGVCNYCRTYDEMNKEYPTGAEGRRILEKLAETIKKEGRGKEYDVIVGVSGGCDSSYLLHLAVELGLRPLAVHYDNTWDSKIAVENINVMLKKLNLNLYTHVVDNEVTDDIFRAFLVSGAPEIDCATDLALATVLYEAAEKYGIKYMFEGHSFRTEGVSPLSWAYMDMKYVEEVVKKYGNYQQHRFRTYPALWFTRFIKFILFNRIKKIRPLYYIDYIKEDVKEFLKKEYGWQWYGGHHLENRIAAFAHTFLFPVRFGIDQRKNGYSAHVRSGQMDREEALRLMSDPPKCDPDIIDAVKKRLRLSDEEFQRVIDQPIRTFKDFKTYKPLFEKLRPFFWLMYKKDLVTKSFYQKYTSKSHM